MGSLEAFEQEYELKFKSSKHEMLENLTNDYTKTLDSIKDQVIDIATKMKHVNNMFILGKGCDTFIAHEGSLKIKEISYIQTEGFAAGEVIH